LEEGTPTDLESSATEDGISDFDVLPSITDPKGGGPSSLAASSTRGAWQRVF